ncbi:MAG: YdeI/OmpD-associated family protein [Acidimicrobiales bacterium]
MDFETTVTLGGGRSATGLAAALDATPGARAAFDALSYSHQRAHVLPIEAAKAPETRQRRIDTTIEMLTG